MARGILIIGEPGTGKSRSIKSLNPAETVIIKPNAKELPFKGAAKNYIVGKNMFVVKRLLAANHPTEKGPDGKPKLLHGVNTILDQINRFPYIKNVIIEDITHFFSKRVIDERSIKGYDKWTELAAHTKIAIIDKESELRPDLNIFVIGHVAATTDAAGNTTLNIQTPGKLMDNVIKIPSYFTYVFHTVVGPDKEQNMKYQFLTNKDGIREAKTPEDMFPKFIDNDMQAIVDGIVAYQNDEGIKPIGLSLEEKAKFDAANKPVIPKAEPDDVEEKEEGKQEPAGEVNAPETAAETAE